MCNGRPNKHVTMVYMQDGKINKLDTAFMVLYLLYDCRKINIFPIPVKINFTKEIGENIKKAYGE